MKQQSIVEIQYESSYSADRAYDLMRLLIDRGYSVDFKTTGTGANTVFSVHGSKVEE
jgi:hypothetical protein